MTRIAHVPAFSKSMSHSCITFQQIQKYEKGTNRVSSAQLSEMAKVLKIETSYFLGEIDHHETVPSQYQAFLATKDGADINAVMIKLPAELRRYIIDFARRLLQLTSHMRN